MKKKIWIIAGAVVLCILIVINIGIFSRRINLDRVEKVQFRNDPVSEGFSAEDTEKFIKLFNSARYAGEGTGDGGTPEIQVYVYYRDGSYLIISEFSGKGRDFEVTRHDANGKQEDWYYISSKELDAFVLEMVDKVGN